MKLRRILILPLLTFVAALSMSASALFAPVTVTLQNKCPRPVKYEIKGGKTSSGTIDASGKVKLSLEPGQQIFADGELCVEVTANDNGTTYIVCR